MSQFHSIPELIEDIRQGKMVILIDDEDRENEGDIVVAADYISPQAINFMASQARGLICLSLTQSQIQRLNLPLMVKEDLNQAPNRTAFTVSIEAAHGVTTGISAADRAHTIRVASNPKVAPQEITVPGHIFPIRAQEGGVLKRAGHTEASVDLATLAGLNPAAVICEIMNEDGSMARVPELIEFSRKHGIKIGTIEDLIEYRIEHDTFVEQVESAPFPTQLGSGFRISVFRNKLDGREHVAITKGSINGEEPVLVRVQTECVMGDVFGSLVHPTHENIANALARIDVAGTGILVYLRMEDMEGRLIRRVEAYNKTIDDDLRTHQMFWSDKRDYGVGAQILRALGVRKIKLLSNHPTKKIGLKGYGLEIVETIGLKEEVESHLHVGLAEL